MAAGKSGGSAGGVFLESGANLLSVEDEDSETSKGKKLNRRSEIVATSSGDFILKTYVRRNKTDGFKTLKGNAIGLNMLSNNKKLSENTQATALCSGTVVHGRRFHHAHVQMPGIKTAAQSNQAQSVLFVREVSMTD